MMHFGDGDKPNAEMVHLLADSHPFK